MFELNQLTEWHISLFVILFGALILYFGKLIGDTKVERYDQLGYYIEGLLFTIVYFVVPILFDYYLLETLFKIPLWLSFLIQLVITLFLSWNLGANEYLRKYGLLDQFKKVLRKELEKIKTSTSLKGKILSKYGGGDVENYVELNVLLIYKIPIKFFGNKYALFLFSLLTILSSLQVLETHEILLIGISFILTFFILSLIAIAYGFVLTKDYPKVKIHLIDNKILKGTVLKYGDFIYMLEGNKKIFVNKDKIEYIEEGLFREGENVNV